MEGGEDDQATVPEKLASFYGKSTQTQRSAGEGPPREGWVERGREKKETRERSEAKREATGCGSRERSGDAHPSWPTMGQWARKQM